jgi:hypothetical protein
MTRSTRHRTVRARRRLADRVRARPRLEGLEDRCVLSPAIAEFPPDLWDGLGFKKRPLPIG